MPSDPFPRAPTTPHHARTLPELLRRRLDDTPDKIAYRHFDLHSGQWQSLSWANLGRLVMRWQQALMNEGLAAGDRVGVLLPNGVDWVGCDQAALALGLVMVPLYMADSPSNWAYQLSHAGVRLIVLDQCEQWLQMAEQAPDLPSLQRVVVAGEQPSTQADDPRLVPLARWLPTTCRVASQRAVAPDDLATIIYTSGTTGPAKRVMLSHRQHGRRGRFGVGGGTGLRRRPVFVLPAACPRLRADHGLLFADGGWRRSRLCPFDRGAPGGSTDHQTDSPPGCAADL